MKPYIIKPYHRRPNRNVPGELEVVIGGTFDVWTTPIIIDGKMAEVLSSERVTNFRGGTRPFTRVTVRGVSSGKHTIQLGFDSQPMTFYTNPLY